MNNEKDPLYEQVRENVTQGQRIPYRQYLRERTAYYIERIANDEELDYIVQSIKTRTIPARETTHSD